MFNTFLSCRKYSDSDYFNGDVREIDDSTARIMKITLKIVPLQGANYGIISVYDSLMLFFNTKLPEHHYNIFNVDTGEEMGSFCRKGGGPEEAIALNPVYQFFNEKNDIKTLLLAPYEGKFFIWNISKSIEKNKAVMDTIFSYNFRNKLGNMAYNYIFRQDKGVLFARVEPVLLNDNEATTPYYQKRTIYSDELLQDYTIYKQPIRNGTADIIPEAFFNSQDAFKPDGSKIAQAMRHLPQINILDTHTSQLVGFRMKKSPNFSFFKTDMKSRKLYYTNLQVDNNYIYALYWGKRPPEKNEKPFIDTIHIFNWQGKLLFELQADQSVDFIHLDQVRNRLYTSNFQTNDVYYLDLNELNM
jgi:hypothetical protein